MSSLNVRSMGAGFIVALAALAACNVNRATDQAAQDQTLSRPDAPIAAPVPAPPPATKEAIGGVAGRVEASREAAASEGLPSQAQLTDTAAVPSMIIRIGEASIEVDSLESAITQVTQLAARLGGFVANTSIQAGPSQIRSAMLTLRIPAARYDEALGGLRPIGEVETVMTNAQDVGEEYVDLRARVDNARRLESRLIALLATRTGKLDDVLAVERELARVREQIERTEGRLRYLRARAAVSTLTITVHEPAPLIGYDPSTNPIAQAFKRAWRNFVAFVAAFIASLGWIIPLGAVAGAVVLTGRRVLAATRRSSDTGDGTAQATA